MIVHIIESLIAEQVATTQLCEIHDAGLFDAENDHLYHTAAELLQLVWIVFCQRYSNAYRLKINILIYSENINL